MTYFGRNVPVQHSKLTLNAPVSLPLRYTTKLLPDLGSQKSETNGRTQIVFEQGRMGALDEIETYLPADVPARPEVRFSTGASWQAIAEGSGKIVDEKAAAKDVQTLVNGLVSGKTTRDERALAIMQYLSREIRYTGVEFGEAAIIPRTPRETLKPR
jgi:transglutaminase-like putative cysteine protease